MAYDMDKMAQFERGIEKMIENACEKDGWICTVAISPDGIASLFMEKLGGVPIAANDEKEASYRCLSFIKEEFGATPNADKVRRDDSEHLRTVSCDISV